MKVQRKSIIMSVWTNWCPAVVFSLRDVPTWRSALLRVEHRLVQTHMSLFRFLTAFHLLFTSLMGLKKSFQHTIYVWWLYWFSFPSFRSVSLILPPSPPFSPLQTAFLYWLKWPHCCLLQYLQPVTFVCCYWLPISRPAKKAKETFSFHYIYHNVVRHVKCTSAVWPAKVVPPHKVEGTERSSKPKEGLYAAASVCWSSKIISSPSHFFS